MQGAMFGSFFVEDGVKMPTAHISFAVGFFYVRASVILAGGYKDENITE